MLNSNVSYPYPLLRETPEDFNESFFNSNMEVLRENQGFRIIPHFSVNNKQICHLLEKGMLSYALQIQCRSTYYRSIEYIKLGEDLFLQSGLLHDLVELVPCIIAMQEISEYHIDDFVPAYKNDSFKLNKNDVVGIGGKVTFRAYYKADAVKKANSILTVNSDENAERIHVELNHPNINVFLPKDQYDSYMKAGTSTKDQIILLNAVISVPAIAWAISWIDLDDNNDYSDYAWYMTLRAQLEKYSNEDPGALQRYLDDPVSTAQMLIGDNTALSLKILDNREW